MRSLHIIYYVATLLNTGNDLTNNAGSSATDYAKNIVTKAADGDSTLTKQNFETLSGAILPTTQGNVIFAWSASLQSVNATSGTNTYSGEAIRLNKGTSNATISVLGGSGRSNTMRVYLYKIVCKTASTWDVTEVTHKDFEFDTVSEADVDYKLSINKEDNKEPKLYANKADADSIGVTLTTSTGAAVPQSKLAGGTISFSIDGKNTDAFKYSAGKIYMTKALDASGKAKMVATFATETSKTATAELEFEYTNEKPYATAGGLYNTTTYAAFDGSEVYASTTGLVNSVTSVRAGGYQVIVYDQYGNNIVTDWPSDAKTDPVSVKVTSAGGTGVTNAIYTTSGITLYGGGTAGTATVVLTSGSVTKTFYVNCSAVAYAANPAATLASVAAAAGSVTVMTYGTANSTTGINLLGTLSDGTAVSANGLSLSKLQWTNTSGVTKTIAADLDGTVTGSETVPTWDDTNDNFKTAATVNAGTYVATFVVDGFDGEATYSFTVNQKTLAANDLVATLTTAGAVSAKAKITLSDGTNDGAFTASDVKSMSVTHNSGVAVTGALDTANHLIWEASANGAQTADITVTIVGQGNYKGSVTYTDTTLADSAVMTLV